MHRQRQKDTLTTVTPAINRNLNNILSRGGGTPLIDIHQWLNLQFSFSEFSRRPNNSMRVFYLRALVFLFAPGATFFFTLLLIVSFTKYFRASEINFCTMGDS